MTKYLSLLKISNNSKKMFKKKENNRGIDNSLFDCYFYSFI